MSRWYCGTQNGDEVLTMDLGHTMSVNAIVNAMGPYASEFPRELVIETSIDGSSWDQAWRGVVIARVIVAAFEEPRSPVMTIPFASRPARYVRLRQVAKDPQFYWSVAELEVRGDR